VSTKPGQSHSHRIDEQFFYWRAPTDNLDVFNEALLNWLKVYNEKKLHGGLNFQTPIEKLWQVWEANRHDPLPQLSLVVELPKRFRAYTEAYPSRKKAA
jgi:hypothetical protein